MTSEKLHDALNLLPADLVAETDALRTQAKKPQVHWQRWAAMAACLAVVLLAGTMFSHFFGHMGSSKTSAAVDKAQMSIAEAAAQKNFGSVEEAAPADGGHSHDPAGEPESANDMEDGYCGNTSATVTLDGSVYTLPGSDAITLTAILEHLDYTSADPKAGGRHPGDRRATGRIIPKYFVLYV